MRKMIAANSVKERDGITFYDFSDEEITLISFSSPFEFIFLPKDAPPLSEIGEKMGFRVVMNGSYFDGTRLDAKHAGWLKIKGETIAPVKKDAQLTHVVIHTITNGRMEFIEWDRFKPGSSRMTIEFQAGPMVIENNTISENFIKSSINGMREHVRTLLGYSSDNLKYFMIIRRKIDLMKLAHLILNLSPFENKQISFINLDGEPSTALWCRDFPEFNYEDHQRLPLLLAVK